MDNCSCLWSTALCSVNFFSADESFADLRSKRLGGGRTGQSKPAVSSAQGLSALIWGCSVLCKVRLKSLKMVANSCMSRSCMFDDSITVYDKVFGFYICTRFRFTFVQIGGKHRYSEFFRGLRGNGPPGCSQGTRSFLRTELYTPFPRNGVSNYTDRCKILQVVSEFHSIGVVDLFRFASDGFWICLETPGHLPRFRSNVEFVRIFHF